MLTPEQIYRRAGGRRHYNAVRKFKAYFRRVEVGKQLLAGLNQSEIAMRLDVHPSTISRDVAALRELAQRERQCPICGSHLSPFESYQE